MARWSGKIGYITTIETERGLWIDDTLIERTHYGDILSNSTKIHNTSDSTNSTLSIANRVSIIADAFAIANFGYMRYVVIKGVKWNITEIKTEHPRLILTVGGLYNGK